MANMKKIVSPSSSEASETQSVDDNNPGGGSGNLTPPTTNANTRNSKNWKRMKDATSEKDADSKRPPWRAVSVSTLPKPDKNALLRAKLLDASRRLRSGKASLAIQTDIEPTKLMKEVAISAQTDLVLYKDVSVMTDGSYAKRKQVSDEFILTYSVSQMTDGVDVQEISTQTLLPKSNGDDFLAAYFSPHLKNNSKQKFDKTEQELLQQIQRIRELKLNYAHLNDGEENKVMIENAEPKRGSNLKATLSSWHFDYETDRNNMYPGYVLDTAGSERTLVPLPLAIGANFNYYNLKLFFLAVDELIQESNALVNNLEQLQQRTEAYDQQLLLKHIANKKFVPKKLNLPSEYWHEVIKQQEEELNELLKSTKSTAQNKVT